MEENNNINENKKSAPKKTGILTQFITGRIFLNTSIQKHVGYIIFLFFLAVIYIGYRYKFENTTIENKQLDNEIKQLNTEYIHKLTELMNKGKKSEVLRQIQKRNLTIKEPQNPFILIKTD
jgi:ABC-type transport system involved in cytochrome bd biosynthesis fused ATPase/permease subunit